MPSTVEKIRYASYGAHTICAIAVIGLTLVYPGPMIVLIIAGILIGWGSLSTVKHRNYPLFVAFGMMLAPAFWMAVFSLKLHNYAGFVPILLLIGSAAWALKKPTWPAAALSTVAVILILALCRYSYKHRFESDYYEPDEIVCSVNIDSIMISLAYLELLLGIAIKSTTPKKTKPQKQRAAIATPQVD